tara:strand:+ start:35 stop:238 length:204 start_codon:yes stop_codon:yes gene_type:complete
LLTEKASLKGFSNYLIFLTPLSNGSINNDELAEAVLKLAIKAVFLPSVMRLNIFIFPDCSSIIQPDP